MNITVGDLIYLLNDLTTYVYVYSYDNSEIYRGWADTCVNCNKSYVKGFDVGENEYGPYINIEVY